MTIEVTRRPTRMEKAAQADPLQTLRDALPVLSGAKRVVAEVILTDPGFAGSASITALAERANSQPATITRLATGLGFSGYPSLRAAIAEENGRGTQAGWETDIGTEIAPTDSAEQVVSVLASRQFAAMRSSMSSLDLDLIEQLADHIVAARRVALFAQWGDLPSAQELQMRLMRMGVHSWLHEVGYESEVAGALMAPGDVALVLCRAGESDLAQRFFTVARGRGATTAVITGEPESTLGKAADLAVFTGTRLGGSWTDYFAGRVSDSFVTSLLFVLVAQRVPAAVRTGAAHLLYNQPRDPGAVS
ncbi:MurR/RpiR family transcriptional regulator [Glaciibacter flavus]|uniref:MurR/RpiR family transcriptional regulator n=1 Tax=Orlajensenia flava TaxID=2565934 RepID=A0A4S4FVT9_9MICO|nr:MurR/RpiR family transcriptional regulator [Glaciibacter flavus]THG33995.1 MurR/RpiR family transcriptional regulator [Glaciibacter flavus]